MVVCYWKLRNIFMFPKTDKLRNNALASKVDRFGNVILAVKADHLRKVNTIRGVDVRSDRQVLNVDSQKIAHMIVLKFWPFLNSNFKRFLFSIFSLRPLLYRLFGGFLWPQHIRGGGGMGGPILTNHLKSSVIIPKWTFRSKSLKI